MSHEITKSVLQEPISLTTQKPTIQHPHSCYDSLGIHGILTALAKLQRAAKASQKRVTEAQPAAVLVVGSVPVSGQQEAAGSVPPALPCTVQSWQLHMGFCPHSRAKPWLCIKEEKGKQEA